MKSLIIAGLLLISNIAIYAQEGSGYGIKFTGFVKTDIFYDSRQTVSAREGHFLLWPAAGSFDYYGEDINAKDNFNILSVQSRLKGSITGPDAFGAKTSGVIEADFFAQANDNINLLRLRHAYVKLNWTNLEVLTGQYWNPLFVTDCFPGTVSFNTGTPLQSFARNPQVRVIYKINSFQITGAALSQRDYASRGANGVSTEYLRNAVLPDLHLQLQYSSGNGTNGNSFVFGGGIAYKSIVPRLKNDINPLVTIKVDEKVSGITAIAYSKITTSPVTVKLEFRYGENISDLLAISGFAVKRVSDPFTGQLEYTPLKSVTYWGEIHTNGKTQFGLFGGFFINLGTKEPMSDAGNDIYGLATDISSLLRLSPRLILNSGQTRLAFEVEYTRAVYGDDYDINYLPQIRSNKVANFRGLVAVYYFF